MEGNSLLGDHDQTTMAEPVVLSASSSLSASNELSPISSADYGDHLDDPAYLEAMEDELKMRKSNSVTKTVKDEKAAGIGAMLKRCILRLFMIPKYCCISYCLRVGHRSCNRHDEEAVGYSSSSTVLEGTAGYIIAGPEYSRINSEDMLVNMGIYSSIKPHVASGKTTKGGSQTSSASSTQPSLPIADQQVVSKDA